MNFFKEINRATIRGSYDRAVQITKAVRRSVRGFVSNRKLGEISNTSVPTEHNILTRNKILPVIDDLLNDNMSIDQRMNLLLKTLGTERQTYFPQIGRYYTYKYMVTTKQEKWDYHPLIICNGYTKSGWKGISMHWDEFRDYSFKGLQTPLYEIYDEELKYIIDIDYMKIVFS